jgi:hypothetical protein
VSTFSSVSPIVVIKKKPPEQFLIPAGSKRMSARSIRELAFDPGQHPVAAGNRPTAKGLCGRLPMAKMAIFGHPQAKEGQKHVLLPRRKKIHTKPTLVWYVVKKYMAN